MDTTAPFIHLMGSEGGASIRGNKVKILKESITKPKTSSWLWIRMTSGADTVEPALYRLYPKVKPISDVMSGYTNNLILKRSANLPARVAK